MKKLKGGAGIFVLGFVLILTIVMVMAVNWVIASGMLSIKLKFDIDIKVDDSGTWATSFLGTETGKMTYMEALGTSETEGYMEKMKDFAEKINGTSVKAKKSIVVQPNIKLGQDSSAEKFTVDIPVPGGSKRILEIRG